MGIPRGSRLYNNNENVVTTVLLNISTLQMLQGATCIWLCNAKWDRRILQDN